MIELGTYYPYHRICYRSVTVWSYENSSLIFLACVHRSISLMQAPLQAQVSLH